VTSTSGAVIRSAELLASLSLATDLGTGQPLGHALRTCLRSVALARALGLDDDAVREVHQVALLRFVGCTADASETATLTGGDNLAFVSAMAPVVMGSQREQLQRLVRSVGAGLPAARRTGRVAAALADPAGGARSLSSHCEVAARLGTRLGLPAGTVTALAHAYERWDGKGHPAGLSGTAVPMSVRIVAVARDADLFGRLAPDEAASILRSRRGRAYDPVVVDALLASDPAGPDLAPGGGDEVVERSWEAVLEAEPSPATELGQAGIDRVLEAVADFADLYLPWTRGRSLRVAELARTAARALGLAGAESTVIWRSALVADVGRVGVPAGVWNRRGPLGVDGWEQVRLHPYWSERVLARCQALEPLAALAGSHQERLDGSGYHRGSDAGSISVPARVLAAADVLVALGEERPHRPALDRGSIVDTMGTEVRSGRLDAEAVDAVCSVGGLPVDPVPRLWPSGLTDREIDVLRRIARGRTNKEVAAELHLSPKTVGRHVENVYVKIGVSSRAAAALFAMEERLLDPD
jgi:HD-GYP domain-containing protein (c-di-GMP phosphodiesterase class II)/DNA-binding CsgD family transcriptional regulator